MTEYIVRTEISTVVEASNEDEALDKAYEYFSRINLKNADIDLDGEMSVDEY